MLAGLGALGASAALPWSARRAQADVDRPVGAATPDAHAVLHERCSGDRVGSRFGGFAGWSFATRRASFTPTTETVVSAYVVIPARQFAMTWTLARNDDRWLPASHTITIAFTLPSGFTHRGIARVAGLAARVDERARRVPFAGLIVKIIDGYFFMGLSSREGDLAANAALLRAHGWFDLAFSYDDGTHAALLFEKSQSGMRAINDALAAWASLPPASAVK